MTAPMTVGALLQALRNRVASGALDMDTPVTDARGNPLVAVWESRAGRAGEGDDGEVYTADLLFDAPAIAEGEPLGIYVTGVRSDTRAAGDLRGPFPNADHARRWCEQTRKLNPGVTVVVGHLVAAEAAPLLTPPPAGD